MNATTSNTFPIDTQRIPRWVRLGYPTFAPERAGQKTCVFWLDEEVSLTLSSGQRITIPRGFTTDGASVPKCLQSIFPALGDHLLADLIHDYLYSTGLLPKAEADREFWRWMMLLRPQRKSRIDNYLRYWAVMLFGRGAYNRKGNL